jgi:hypothetical protein
MNKADLDEVSEYFVKMCELTKSILDAKDAILGKSIVIERLVGLLQKAKKDAKPGMSDEEASTIAQKLNVHPHEARILHGESHEGLDHPSPAALEGMRRHILPHVLKDMTAKFGGDLKPEEHPIHAHNAAMHNDAQHPHNQKYLSALSNHEASVKHMPFGDRAASLAKFKREYRQANPEFAGWEKEAAASRHAALKGNQEAAKQRATKEADSFFGVQEPKQEEAPASTAPPVVRRRKQADAAQAAPAPTAEPEVFESTKAPEGFTSAKAKTGLSHADFVAQKEQEKQAVDEAVNAETEQEAGTGMASTSDLASAPSSSIAAAAQGLGMKEEGGAIDKPGVVGEAGGTPQMPDPQRQGAFDKLAERHKAVKVLKGKIKNQDILDRLNHIESTRAIQGKNDK